MPNKKIFIAALSMLILLSGHVRAESLEEAVSAIHVTSQDHLLIASKKDPSDPNSEPSQQLMHENRLGAETGPYRMGIHFTNKLYLNNQGAANSSNNKPFTLEKKHLTAEFSNWDIQLGDSYQEIGKGIALSLYQDDVFGLNNTLEGASIKYRPKGFEVMGFAGRLNAITSPVAVFSFENPIKNRNVWLMGSSVGGNPWEGAKITGHYLLALNTPTNYSGYDKTWTTIGTTIQQNNLFPAGEGYAEVNALISHVRVSGRDTVLPTGWGAYSSISWAPAPWKVKWEGKLYEDYVFEFRRPPTLEEDIVETTNTSRVVGSKWAADYRINAGKGTVGGSYLVAYDRMTQAPIHHWVGSGKYKVSSIIELEGKSGYRTSPNRNWLAHASFKGKLKTFKGQWLELGYRKQYGRIKLDLLPATEDRNAIDFSYVFSERISTGLGYEYLPENAPEFGKHFANVSTSLRFGALAAKAMLGQTSGGTLCSAGICRQVPAFTGAQVETTYSF